MADGLLRWPVSGAVESYGGWVQLELLPADSSENLQRDRLSARRATACAHAGLESCGFAASARKSGLALTIGGISAKSIWRRIGAACRIGVAHCWRGGRRRGLLGGTSGQQKQQRRNQAKFHESLHRCKTHYHIALTLISHQLILPIASGETRPELGQANFFLSPQRGPYPSH
jgi:hypothetical protein